MRPKIGDRVLITRGGLGTHQQIKTLREKGIKLIGRRISKLKERPANYYGINFRESDCFVELENNQGIWGLGRGHGLVRYIEYKGKEIKIVKDNGCGDCIFIKNKNTGGCKPTSNKFEDYNYLKACYSTGSTYEYK